jgi:hypothetical protein
MADDKADFIERAESISKNWTGEKWSPDAMVNEFHLYSLEKRANALDDLDRELREMGPVDTSQSSLRRHANLHRLRARLDEVHHALRKANR